MFSTSTVILVVLLYMAFLFVLAQKMEKHCTRNGKNITPPYVYALAITVYCTSWTFYGSVGFAAESGLLFFAIYIGAILAILGWWRTLRRIVHVKESYHISSIADFISARYNRSQTVAALVTLIALVGIVPYIALQLKSIINTLNIISPLTEEHWGSTGLMVTLVMALFTVTFGARHLDPTERHPGMMMVLAVQGLIKLVAFLAVGIFVTYGLYGGFTDIFELIHYAGLTRLIESRIPQGSPFAHWVSLILLGAASIQCLPRQFHVAVVENSNERDIRRAMWLVPLYLVVINLFVIPIAAAGQLKGMPPGRADEFVLLLPQIAGNDWLALLVFIGGFSAAAGMVIISTMTLSTMATNHLLLPLIDGFRPANVLRHYLLQLRWTLILLIMCAGYWFAWEFSDTYMLAAMGMISFVAVCQFVPALFGGLRWRGANRIGAIAGLLVGFLTWFYTLVVPAFVNLGWVDPQLLLEGPGRIHWLRPEALLGLEGLSPVSHSLFWSLLLNGGCFVLGSLLHRPSKLERTQLGEFMNALESGSRVHKGRPTGLEAYIQFPRKRKEATRLLAEYLPQDKAESEITRIAEDLQVSDKDDITIIELVEFHRMLENLLSGSIGAASAHRAIETHIGYSDRETRDLQAIYSHIVNELHGPDHLIEAPARPGNPTTRYSFVEELQGTIERQKQELANQRSTLKRLELKLDHNDQQLFDQRVANQRLTQEIKELRKQLNPQTEE